MSTLAVIDLLPEIWTEIFKLSVDSDMDSVRSTFTNQNHNSLLTLTRVCSNWRKIAVSTPFLWARFQIQTNSWIKTPKQKESYTNLVNLWLDRSQLCPLAIFFVDLQGTKRRTVNHRYIPERIMQECHRWETLHFKAGRASQYTQIFAPLKGRLISLKSITVLVKPNPRATEFFPTLQTHPLLTFIEGATKLDAIHLTTPGSFFSSNLPFADLTIVDLVADPFCFEFPLPAVMCLAILRMCPKLSLARLNCGPVTGGTIIAPITHPNLCELGIFETHAQLERPGTKVFLQKLDAPYLTRLSITTDRDTPDGEPSRWDHQALHDFLLRSRCLERLNLRFPNNGQVNAREGIDYLLRSPDLRHFSLSIFHDPQATTDHDTLLTFLLKDGCWPLTSISHLHYWIVPHQKIFNVSTERLIKQEKYDSGVLCVPEL